MSRSATIVPPERTTQPTGTGERADVGEVDADACAPLRQLREQVGRDRHDHALLRLRQPDLPRLEARDTSRGTRSSSTSAPTPSRHLADGGRQSASSTVGDRRVQVLGADERIDQELLDDRIADLDAGPGDLAGGGVHRRRRERGTTDPVATGRPAEHDHPVTGERAVVDRTGRCDADTAGEHQRVGGVRLVVEDRSGDGRQADLVAVVGHPVDDARTNTERME